MTAPGRAPATTTERHLCPVFSLLCMRRLGSLFVLIAFALNTGVASAQRSSVSLSPTDSAESTNAPDDRLPEATVCPVGCAPVPDRRSYDRQLPRASLAAWAHSRRWLVLDRIHSYGDRVFDRGIFRHVTPEMDREYSLDLMAYRFSPFENARWAAASSGIRLRAGSIERDILAIKTEIKNTVGLNDRNRHYFSLEGILQEDAQVNRSVLELSYAYRWRTHHAVGVRHTFSEQKVDLDLTPFYAYASPEWGRAEIALTVQNLYNDFIYDRLGIDAEVLDVVRTYDRRPFLLEAQYSSPDRYPLGGEFIIGWQPTSRATYASQRSPSYRFQDEERIHYIGALLEYRWAPFSVGVYFKRDASRLHRQSTGDSLNTDYRSRQTLQRFGAFMQGRWGPLRGEVQAFTGIYNDIQEGDNYQTSILERAISFDTEQSGLHSRLLYDVDGWPYVGVEYLAFRRDLGPNPRALVNGWTFQYWDFGPSNYRLVGLVGYRFDHGSIALGMGYDTDGDPLFFTDREPRRFDNGFLRFTLVW